MQAGEAGASAAAEAEAGLLAERLAATRFDGLSGRLLELDDPETVWIVLAGRVDVQAVPLRAGSVAGMGRHLFEAGPGHLIPGTPPQPGTGGDTMGFRGRCGAGTVLARTTRERLRALSLDLEALVAIERWVDKLAAVAAPEARSLSSGLLEADPRQDFPAGAVLCAPHGSIVWCVVEHGEVLGLGDPAWPLRVGDPAWPLTEANWITLPAAATVTGQLTPARMASGAIWNDLDAFGRLALRRMVAERAVAAAADAGRQMQRAAWTRARFDDGLLQLGRAADESLPGPSRDATPADAWADSFALVARASGIDLPPAGPHTVDLEQAALAAGVAFRTVKLLGDWYRHDNGPLLGFVPDTAAPDGQRAVALLPDGPRAYRATSSLGDPGQRVTPAIAATLGTSAVMLYRPLPSAVKTLWPMLRFAAHGLRGDLVMVLLMGLAVGLLGMLTPIASGTLVENVLPRADLPLHIAIIAGLAAAALGNAAFSVVQSIAVTRVQARVDLTAESAVWNRLLRLRTGFFRAHSTGDLADRANGVSEIRRAVTGAATTSLLSGLFALLSGALLFWYSTRLALIALGFTVVVILVQLGLFLLELPRQRQVVRANGKLESMTFETLSAMPKLRAAAAEPRAFARWSALFGEQTRLRRRAANVNNLREVLEGVFPLIGTGLIWAGAIGAFGGTGSEARPALTLGAFVAFQGAFGSFLGGVVSLVQAGQALVGVVPVWERLRPILQAEPETGVDREPVGRLRGSVAVSNLSFRYGPEAPPALEDVSLAIAAGEYVALVGPSGSGKSTLVRMILGLEQPSSGAVYVDGMDLATIDLAAMRRQFGVVMQGGQLVPGSILENILGATPLSEDAAWEAARQAGLAADIREMPMRMQTVIAEGGGGLSGGQRQRLLIARALVRKPRILIFDEATSALDNATQSEVKDSLDKLNVTRIVVAHRLSTIRDVHRIVVLEAGRMIEQGTYDELMARNGLFARLAARQMA